MVKVNRKTEISILAIINIISSIILLFFGILGSITLIFEQKSLFVTIPEIWVISLTVSGFINLVVGVGLLKLKNWARIMAMIFTFALIILNFMIYPTIRNIINPNPKKRITIPNNITNSK